jgi:hypothetical protein
MAIRGNIFRACLFGAALPLAMAFGSHSALASDPLPGDGIAPPVNINIMMYYNQFENAGEIGAVHGSSYDQHTRISADISVLRYIRTFDVGSTEAGLQVYEPYVAFLGPQEAGVQNIPGPNVPALGGQLPSYGAGRANLSHSSGWGQPNFGAFLFPVNHPKTGTYLVIAPWISPPISGYNKNSNLNPGNNVWTYEMEAGFRTTLFGTPTTKNLSVSVWGEAYWFGDNTNSAYVSPSVSAVGIPPIYSVYNALSGGLIPDQNPLAASSVTPATFHEQSSEEFRIYFPYEFAPAMGAYIAPGFYQSFGGKQTYTLRNGAKVDSGNRTDESQLRLIAASFVSPTLQVMLVGEYDVANHGGPLYRTVELRLAKFF